MPKAVCDSCKTKPPTFYFDFKISDVPKSELKLCKDCATIEIDPSILKAGETGSIDIRRNGKV